MPSYATSIEIAAPVAEVWAATCDVESWPSFSPTMTSVRRTDSGPIGVGSTAKVRQPRSLPGTWVVRECLQDSVFTWSTKSPGFEVVAEHVLTATAGGTSMRLVATMTGPLAGTLWALTGRTVRRYLDLEAAAFKTHCESSR